MNKVNQFNDMASKKILALDQGEYIGGAELFFSDLLTRVSRDFEIHLITGKNKKYQENYKNFPVILHEVELPALKPIGIKTFKKYHQAQKEIEKIIEKIKPDQIISNTVRTHLLVSALAKKKATPLIWMAHDLTFPKLFLKWFKKYPKKIICCSEFVENYYKNLIKSKGIEYKILYPFGIEKDELKSLEGIPKEKVIGMIGKFIPWKGQDLFIELAQEIHQNYPDYRFEIIGTIYENNEESKKFYSECQASIKKFKLQEVFKIKPISQDVLKEIAPWEILIHCSRTPEPLGRVILEGMVVGCGVVASHLGGPKEVIHEGRTGLIAEPTVRGILEATQKYLGNSKFKERVSIQAQREITEKYEWPKVIEEFKNILKTD